MEGVIEFLKSLLSFFITPLKNILIYILTPFNDALTSAMNSPDLSTKLIGWIIYFAILLFLFQLLLQGTIFIYNKGVYFSKIILMFIFITVPITILYTIWELIKYIFKSLFDFTSQEIKYRIRIQKEKREQKKLIRNEENE